MTYELDELALFTGETLFLSGVGRPHLEATPEETEFRTRLLYRSPQRLATLHGDAIVLPGHTSGTIGFKCEPIGLPLGEVLNQVKSIHLPEDDFVRGLALRIPPTPPNHAAIVSFNEAGEMPLGDPTDLEAGANRCAVT